MGTASFSSLPPFPIALCMTENPVSKRRTTVILLGAYRPKHEAARSSHKLERLFRNYRKWVLRMSSNTSPFSQHMQTLKLSYWIFKVSKLQANDTMALWSVWQGHIRLTVTRSRVFRGKRLRVSEPPMEKTVRSNYSSWQREFVASRKANM